MSARLDSHSSPSPTPLAVAPLTACDLLEISPSHCYSLMRNGELRSYSCGRSRRITVESIHRYIERRLAESAATGWRAWEHNPQSRRKRQEATAAPQKRRARIDQYGLNAE